LYSFEREADAVAPDLVIIGLDTNFVFGNNFGPPLKPYVLNGADLALFAAMSGYWTRFAARGNPNNDGVDVHWAAFKRANYIAFDWPLRERRHWREDHCDFWEPFFLRSVSGSVQASQP
jgi:carboxylesterase type B